MLKRILGKLTLGKVGCLLGILIVLLVVVDIIGDRLWEKYHLEIDDFYCFQWSYLHGRWKETGEIGAKPSDPERPILVIDPSTCEVRLERPEGPHPGENLKLPRGWKWQIVYWTGSGPIIQKSPIRLRMRSEWVIHDGLRYQEEHNAFEEFELRGTHWLTREKVSIQILLQDLKYPREFTKNLSLYPGDDIPISTLVNNYEYKEALKTWDQTKSEPDEALTASLIMEERWVRFRDRLPQQLRAHMEEKGFDRCKFHLYGFNGREVPYTPLGSQIQVVDARFRRPSLPSVLLHGRNMHYSFEGYALRYVGGTTWALFGGRQFEDDNFLLSGDPEEDPEVWHDTMMRIKEERDGLHRRDCDPRYTAILTDGTQVELIGVCERATLNAQWWRPNGTPLDWKPCIVPNQEFIKPSENRQNVFAYNVLRSTKYNYDYIKTAFTESKYLNYPDNSVNSWGGYERTPECVVASFSKQQNTTSLNLKFIRKGGNYPSITFNNIALYPDQSTSVTIETTPKEGR